MRLRSLLTLSLTIVLVFGRKFPMENLQQDTKGDNFVLVGASSSSSSPILKFEDDNKLRSAYYYPMIVKPTDYPMAHNHHQSPNSLLNLNLGLLEPFMLVTFLLFVLNLIDKAKILHLAKTELENNRHRDYDNNPDSNYYYIKRNSTV